MTKEIKLIKKQKGVSVKQTVIKILDTEYNPYSVHPSNVMNWKQNQTITLLAEQIDTLWQIVTAYKTGKL
jgi:hypothetical protein